jgi:hypothetical protein
MTDFINLVVCALITGSYFVAFMWSHRAATADTASAQVGIGFRSLARRLVFVALYTLTLIFALRFGSRTYPGIWYSSRLLNDLFNGSLIFWLAEDLVGIAAVLALFDELWRYGNGGRRNPWTRAITGMRYLLIGIGTAVALYGFYFALVLCRLPDRQWC